MLRDCHFAAIAATGLLCYSETGKHCLQRNRRINRGMLTDVVKHKKLVIFNNFFKAI